MPRRPVGDEKDAGGGQLPEPSFLQEADGDDLVLRPVVFVDAELNKYLSGGSFLGTGLSLWDITRSDTFTPAWMLHFGIPLGDHPAHPVYFLAEGRLFFDNIDDVSNNYQFWGGVRVHF